MKSIRLREGKERSLLRRHPWVFQGSIEKGKADSGETVRVEAADGRFLAWGAFSPTSMIRVRGGARCRTQASPAAVRWPRCWCSLLATRPSTALRDWTSRRLRSAPLRDAAYGACFMAALWLFVFFDHPSARTRILDAMRWREQMALPPPASAMPFGPTAREAAR